MRISIEIDTSGADAADDYEVLLRLAKGLCSVPAATFAYNDEPNWAEVKGSESAEERQEVQSGDPLPAAAEAQPAPVPIVSASPVPPARKKPGRKSVAERTAVEAAEAEIRAAEQAAMAEAIANLSKPPAPPPLPSTPPPSPRQELQPPPLPPLPQTPAMPGAAATLPVIPPNGADMPLNDLMTVVRMASMVDMGVAFTVMQKHRVFNPKDVPENFRAQLAREIAVAAGMIAA